jgi:hypothetical protein
VVLVAGAINSDRLIRTASRFGKVPAGSAEAERAIHEVLKRTGPVLPYTTAKSAAAELLPPGFEWREAVYSAGQAYASCKRSGMDGEYPYPHHGQWAATEPLAMCGAVLGAWVMLAKG